VSKLGLISQQEAATMQSLVEKVNALEDSLQNMDSLTESSSNIGSILYGHSCDAASPHHLTLHCTALHCSTLCMSFDGLIDSHLNLILHMPLLSTRDPVRLPTSNIVVDRSTIAQHLLNDETGA
jgi:U-box domain